MRVLAAGIVAILLAVPGHAYFEAAEVGARALALGHSFVSVADDASAVYWNPAGLVALPHSEFLLSYDEAADVDGMRHGFAALALHPGPVSVGFGWRHGGTDAALREDVVYLSIARTAIRRSLGAFASGGATLKVARLGLDIAGFEDVSGLHSSATRVTADAGILLAPIPNVTTGVMVRNLGQPTFDLLEGGTRTAWEHEVEWGVSLRWREDAWLHVSRLHHPRASETRVAGEYRIAGVLGVRAGVGRQFVAGGIGVAWERWTLDAAYRTRDILGWTYRIGLRRGFGAERATAGGDFDSF